jgi:hypothetical protein
VEKIVVYPSHVLEGIKPNHRAHPLPDDVRIFGADTETVHGIPHTVQVCEDGRTTFLQYVNVKTVLPTFWELIRPAMIPGGLNLCYFHNLKFDLMVLFADHHREVYEQINAIKFHLDVDARPLPAGWYKEPHKKVLLCEILFGKVNAAEITEGFYYLADDEQLRFTGEAKLKILDSRAFTLASLSRSLKMYHIPEVKLKAPDGLGDKPLRTPEFETYAKQDVIAEHALATQIVKIHGKYQVRPSISLPQFIARVFRHDFFKQGWKVEFPPLDCVRAAELSYHGGKNGFYLDGPQVLDDVSEIDINSAFPWAMRELPSFIGGQYKKVDRYVAGAVGVFCLTGRVQPETKYPLVFDHGFRPVRGAFEDTWTTSYETAAILSCIDVTVTKCHGWIWEPEDAGGPNPFRDFVDTFYKLKDTTPKTDPYYHFYKIALNSLYGKLVGAVEEHDVDILAADTPEGFVEKGVGADYHWDEALKTYIRSSHENVAGQMYHPLIASLITGRVRALIYELETKYQALHTATDSIKTLLPVSEKPGLGGWKLECSGRCYMFRNKLYLHFDKTAKPPDKEAWNFGLTEKGQQLTKAAFHGFKGPFRELFDRRGELLKNGEIEYSYRHVVGLREGMRRGETPADFVTRTETMKLKREAVR